MNWHAHIRSEFTRLGKHADETVVEELAQHAAAAFEAARAEGQPGDDAGAEVRALVTSWCEKTSGPRRIERAPLLEPAPATSSPFAGLGLDFRHAARLIRRQPAFAVVSILMIALGIGATTSLFSIVNSVLLKPLPWARAEGLVRVFETGEQQQTSAQTSSGPTITNLTYRAWAEKPAAIDGLGAWRFVSMALESPSGVELVYLGRVTASLFPLIGASPLIGVNFTEAQEVTDDAMILSHGFWTERYGGSPDALGQRLTMGGRARTIVGVMPPGFEFPNKEARLWIPERVPPAIERKTDGDATSISVQITRHFGLARLRPDVTPAQATSEAGARADGAAKGFEQLEAHVFGGDGKRRITVAPMLDFVVKDVKPALWILLAAVGLLLAAAIGNVANMQLARAAMRRREIAIRAAIGAGSGRVTRELLVETSLLTLIGGVLGLGLTAALLRVLPAFLPEDFPRALEIAVDTRVLIVVTALTMAVSVAVSLLPARMARRVKLTSALAEDGAAPVGQSLRSPAARTRTLIITSQVAIAALLLVGAALLSQSFVQLLHVDRGYQPESLLTARITHMARGLPPGARPIFYRDVLERLGTTPGVTQVGLSNALPLTPYDTTIDLTADGATRLRAVHRIVSTGYIAAMGMRIVQGRGFADQDVPGSEPVMLVNETFVNRYRVSDPLETSLSLPRQDESGRTWRVIGVLADVRQRGADEPVQPEVYVTLSQIPAGPAATQFLTARTLGDPAALTNQLRTIIRGASANGVLEQVMTMENRLMTSLARPRLYAVLLGGFAIFASLIAVIGLFGGLSYGVTQRTREIGVRSALGATPGEIVSMILKQGAVMTVAGLAVGLGGAAASVRYLSAFLFGVTPFDPATFTVVGMALLVIAFAACAIPARRAARIDAVEALKQ